MKLNPDNHLVFYNSGVCNKQLGNYKESINDFEKCLKIKNNYLMAYTMLGRVYTLDNQIDKAIESYSYSLKVKNNSGIFFDRGIFYIVYRVPLF
jgi:tetratricopeptide (TPR) repeat protein